MYASSVREPRVEVARDQRLADGAHRDAEDGDPDLHRADEPHGLVHQAQGAACRQRVHLLETPAARGHERVLGRDEDRVPQHEQEHEDDAEEVAHAPLSGARVLGGCSSSKLRLSIGESPVVLVAPRAALADEALQVRQRLGDREPARRRVELGAEERERDLVARARLRPERGRRRVQALAVVLDDLAGARGRVLDRLAVAGQREPQRRAPRCARASRGSRRAGRGASPGRGRPRA